MDAKRDWGHARDYVEMQWLMLQQEKADDFVIASGVQHSVRDFVDLAARKLGLTLSWKGDGLKETGTIDAVDSTVLPQPVKGAGPKPGDVIVRVDPRYFRPTEVETLLGDASKAKNELGWEPKTTFDELVSEMVESDLQGAKRDELCKSHGFSTFDHHE
jgi:GDPmannose 4,6-dehydratase